MIKKFRPRCWRWPARVLPLRLGRAAAADDQPWVLDANNWQEGKDLLPEPVLKRLKDGQYWFKVVPVDPAKFKENYSKKFWDLTEANEGKYDLDAKRAASRTRRRGRSRLRRPACRSRRSTRATRRSRARSRRTSRSPAPRAAAAVPPSRSTASTTTASSAA